MRNNNPAVIITDILVEDAASARDTEKDFLTYRDRLQKDGWVIATAPWNGALWTELLPRLTNMGYVLRVAGFVVNKTNAVDTVSLGFCSTKELHPEPCECRAVAHHDLASVSHDVMSCVPKALTKYKWQFL